MNPDRVRNSDLHEDERTRDRREKRIRDEEQALARRRMQPLLVVVDPLETDFPGCTT